MKKIYNDDSKLFFTSDHHFGHKNILKYCAATRHEFVDVAHMDAEYINRWNSIVPKDGIVYYLGDFTFYRSQEQVNDLLSKLNGTIYLIRGNHDTDRRIEWYQQAGILVRDYEEIIVKDEEIGLEQRIVLMHFPIESWHHAHHGAFHLHGHCHGTLKSDDTKARMDVGVDTSSGVPYSYNRIKEIMTKKVFKPVDHHGTER